MGRLNGFFWEGLLIGEIIAAQAVEGAFKEGWTKFTTVHPGSPFSMMARATRLVFPADRRS